MRTVSRIWILLTILSLSPAGAKAEGANEARRPPAFPSLSQLRGTNIFYSAVALDTWTGKVAYLAFDGNSSTGFSRMFAWIPNDTRLGRPMEFKPKAVDGDPNRFIFGEVENKALEGDEKVEMLWRFGTTRRVRGAGSSTSVDYVTGKTVAHKWGAATWHEVNFSLKFGYAYGKTLSGLEGGMPLELTHDGTLTLYNSWSNMPMPSTPISTTIQARHALQETRDAKKGRLLCRFANYAGPSVTRAPQEGNVTFLVIPYMSEPVYSNTVAVGEFIKSGFDTEVPYGWYSLRIGGFRYGRFRFNAHLPQLGIDPVPLSRSSTTSP